MTTLEDVITAVRESDDTGWRIADAIAALPEADDDGPLTNARIATYIAEHHPKEYSPAYIGGMRQTSIAFPVESRLSTLSFEAHRILRAHPEKLRKWAEKNPGKVLTAQEAAKLRPSSSAKKTDAELDAQEWRKLLKRMDELVDHDPGERTLDLEDRARRYRQSYGRQIARAEQRSVLHAV